MTMAKTGKTPPTALVSSVVTRDTSDATVTLHDLDATGHDTPHSTAPHTVLSFNSTEYYVVQLYGCTSGV